MLCESTHCFEQHDVAVVMCKNEAWFRAQDVATVLGYSNTRQAVAAHVTPKYIRTLTELRQEAAGNNVCPADFIPEASVGRPANYINESGVYELIFHSKKTEALQFRAWIVEEVLPQIVRTGRYELKQEQVQLLNETDLHYKVVQFLRKSFPEAIVVAGLGELQDTKEKRIDAKNKGYTKGQSDLLILNRTRWHNGLAIELKTPNGRGVTSPEQTEFLERLAAQRFDTLVSNCYDDIVVKIMEHRTAARRCRTRAVR
jgi:prophage antirepressor-like protein